MDAADVALAVVTPLFLVWLRMVWVLRIGGMVSGAIIAAALIPWWAVFTIRHPIQGFQVLWAAILFPS